MMNKENKNEMLEEMVIDALDVQGNSTPVAVSKYIWDVFGSQLKASGDLLYTWQYDIRWAVQRLSKAGKVFIDTTCKPTIWSLTYENVEGY